MTGWQKIETLPEAEHVMLWFPDGERGIGGIECATVFFGERPEDEWSYWTHGGPNSGIDWYPRNNERPSHWMPLPEPPLPSPPESSR